MNETSWETIELRDGEYDELIVFDGKVYADAFIESVEELEGYSVLTPNEILETVVVGLFFAQYGSFKEVLDDCESELKLLGIEVEWFETISVDVDDNHSSCEFVKLSVAGKATRCIQNVVYAEHDLWGEVCGYNYDFHDIEESNYNKVYQSEIEYLKQSAAKFGYQLIPA